MVNYFIFYLFPIKGLKLNLFIESFEYVSQLSHTAGARVVIHNQGEMPFPDEEGINLAPGFSTSIGVRRVETFFTSSLHISDTIVFISVGGSGQKIICISVTI